MGYRDAHDDQRNNFCLGSDLNHQPLGWPRGRALTSRLSDSSFTKCTFTDCSNTLRVNVCRARWRILVDMAFDQRVIGGDLAPSLGKTEKVSQNKISD